MNKPESLLSTLTVQNKAIDCARLTVFLADYLKTNNIPDSTHHDLRLIVEETFTNIINHAFTDDKEKSILIEISHTNDAVKLTFIDEGVAFNPLAHEKVEETGTIKTTNYCDGGMGIQIIKSLTERQEYSRINHRNVLSLTKHYTK